MSLHPAAEAYRQALAAGDNTGAAGLLMEAHSGTYDSALIDQFHAVSRMTRDQLNAPAASSDIVTSDPNEIVRVTTRVFRGR